MNTQTPIPLTVKKSKVTSATFKKEWQGRDGAMFDFNIEFENGDKGVYQTNQREQKAFKEGNEVDYSIETKFRNGFSDVAIKYIAKKNFSSNGKHSSERNYKFDFISFAASYTKDLIVGGKVPMKDFKKTFNDIYSDMIEKLEKSDK